MGSRKKNGINGIAFVAPDPSIPCARARKKTARMLLRVCVGPSMYASERVGETWSCADGIIVFTLF